MSFFLGIIYKSSVAREWNKIMKSFFASLLAFGAAAVTLESEFCVNCAAVAAERPIVTIPVN